MNLAILALVAVIFSFPHIAHEQEPESGPGTSVLDFAEALPPKLEMPKIMAKIAVCESQNRHFNNNGEIIKGNANKYDIGRYQINVLYWGDEAKTLGYDIYTAEGNESMALELYRRYGTSPWKSSQKCWNK